MGKNKKIFTLVFGILVLLIALGAVTYAYFSITVLGNEEASSMTVTTANLSAKFTDGPFLTMTDVFPDNYVEKEFDIENTGSDIIYFDILMKDVYTNIIQDELVYYLYKKDTNNIYQLVKDETLINNDAALLTRIALSVDEKQYYKIKILFKEMSYRQNYNQGGEFRGKISIMSPYKYNVNGVALSTLKDRILLDNTSYADNVSSKYVTTNGINFANPSDYGYQATYKTEIKDVSFESNANKFIGTSFTYGDSKPFVINNGTWGNTFNYSSIGKYVCATPTQQVSCKMVYKILETSGSTVTRVEAYTAKEETDTWNGMGLYNTNVNTEDNLVTHYFRGNIHNNYVSFANFLWRIVRINENGSIRLIKEENIGNSAYNTLGDSVKYIGYMSGTDAEPYSNATDSTIKVAVDDWYDSDLLDYSSYFDTDSQFCNDRTIYSSESDIIYGQYNRVGDISLRLGCYNDSDKFTLSTSSVGNKALATPIGLLTVAETIYSGGAKEKISEFYLENGTDWWTMSPYKFSGNDFEVYSYQHFGYVATGNENNTSYGVRPVINLNSSVLVSEGSGSENDPYGVVLN